MRKRIGISFSEANFKNYLNWFSNEDLQNNIEVVVLSSEKSNEEDIYRCDGFILTGGVDVHPAMYGGQLEYNNKPNAFSETRDRLEAKIYQHSQENGKPLLGICRGLQLVNVLHGGKLIQDLDVNGNKIHRREADADKQHQIEVQEDSFLFDVTHCRVGNVNSAHHQAINPDAIGENLVVNAVADTNEKIIEGIEFKDKTDKAYMLCVQWHPERMEDQESAFSKNLKRSFLEAVALL